MQENYRELFVTESAEYLKSIGQDLIVLEQNPADTEAINNIFRATHSMKGMAASLGLDKLANLSHHMEDVLDGLRSAKLKVTPEMMNILFSCLDIMQTLVDEVSSKQDTKLDINPYIEALNQFFSGQGGPGAPAQAVEAETDSVDFTEIERQVIKNAKDNGYSTYVIKISIAKDCMLKPARVFIIMNHLDKMGEIIKSNPSAEDLELGKFGVSFIIVLITKEAAQAVQQELFTISEVDDVRLGEVDASAPVQAKGAPAVPGAAMPQAVSYVKKIQSMRISVDRLDKIMNLTGELITAKTRLTEMVQSYKIEPLQDAMFFVERLISDLQDEVMQTRLLPIAYVLDTFPRMVRDLAQKENKDITFEISGSEIELDRLILDELGELLTHLLRNAVDHGIETAQERSRLKKDPQAKIKLKVSRERGKIFIEISDDGRGVSFEAVRRIALERGLINQEEASHLDEKAVLDLLTMPGFSTKEKATALSGRGVGLDVVKAKAEALGGRLDFDTKEGVGSRFILMLPLTVAIIKALAIRVSGQTYLIPLVNVREIVKISPGDIKPVQNFEMVRVRDEVIPVIRLHKELYPAQEAPAAPKRFTMVIIETKFKGAGVIVDEVLGEQEIVVKPLGVPLKRIKGITAATVMGNGKVALILDVIGLK
jgi:two-component system chemotaxis sensor kinase CheA